MPRHYPPEYKAGVLERLRAYHGDITLVSRLTGVPERTLRHWRREIWLDLLPPLPPLPHMPPPPPLPDRQSDISLSNFEDAINALKFMRENLMNGLVNLSAGIRDAQGLMTPYQRVQMITQLMNRMLELNEYLYSYEDDPEDNQRPPVRRAEPDMESEETEQTDSGMPQDDAPDETEVPDLTESEFHQYDISSPSEIMKFIIRSL